MNKYRCDICWKEEEYIEVDKREYYGWNSTYGYCDKPECKKEANRKVGADIYEAAGRGDFEAAEDLIGDSDIFEFI